MALIPVDSLSIRIGSWYCAKHQGQVYTVKLIECNKNGHAYTVETVGREPQIQFKTSTLYYAATIGYPDDDV